MMNSAERDPLLEEQSGLGVHSFVRPISPNT